jgi:hypothetical protein
MPVMRLDPTTGEGVIIAPDRARRPHDRRDERRPTHAFRRNEEAIGNIVRPRYGQARDGIQGERR